MAISEKIGRASDDIDSPENVCPSECKLATVIVAAIPDFRVYVDSVDVQTEGALLKGYFERFRRVIEHYDGLMAEFTSESIMAVFGIPDTHDDDAERACRVALEIVRLLEEVSAECKLRLDLSFGIDTGNVTVVRIGNREHQELVFVGEAVKTAKMLKDSSKQGEILVSQETYRLTSHLFAFQNLGEIQVHGQADGILSYRLLRARSGPSQTDRIAVRRMSFSGRRSQGRVEGAQTSHRRTETRSRPLCFHHRRSGHRQITPYRGATRSGNRHEPTVSSSMAGSERQFLWRKWFPTGCSDNLFGRTQELQNRITKMMFGANCESELRHFLKTERLKFSPSWPQ